MLKMKRLFLVFSIIGLISFSGMLQAQNQLKIGYINSQELIQAMPESDSAQAKIQRHAKQLQDQMEQMQVEFNNKYENYISQADGMSDLIKQTKETELQEMNQRIQQFQSTAQDDLQNTRQKLFKPILDKANKAIADVSKENTFTYVFDVSSGALIYQSDSAINIMPLVKKKLGLE